jgi:hypothetical protein
LLIPPLRLLRLLRVQLLLLLLLLLLELLKRGVLGSSRLLRAVVPPTDAHAWLVGSEHLLCVVCGRARVCVCVCVCSINVKACEGSSGLWYHPLMLKRGLSATNTSCVPCVDARAIMHGYGYQ